MMIFYSHITKTFAWLGIGLMGVVFVLNLPSSARAEKSLPALIQDLQDKDYRVRVRAAKALGSMGPQAKEAAPALIQAIFAWKLGEPRIPLFIVDALKKIGQDPVDILLEALKDKDRAKGAILSLKITNAMKQLDPSALRKSVPVLIKVLESEEVSVRREAVQILGAIGPDASEAVPILIQALNDKDAFLRGEVARALGKIGPGAKKAVHALIEALKDKEDFVRDDVVITLSGIGPFAKEAIPALTQTLNDKNEAVASRAKMALRSIGPTQVKPISALLKDLQNQDEAVQAEASDALATLGPAAKQTIPVLVQALKDTSVENRLSTVKALRLILSRSETEEAVPALMMALKDHDPRVRSDAAYAFSFTGRVNQEFIKKAVSALSQALRDENEKVRSFAAFALQEIGPEAVSTLVEAMKDKNPDVRSKAAKAFGSIDHWAAQQAIPHLRQGLKDEDQGVRINAAFSLGLIDIELETKEVIPVLNQALNSEEREIRVGAVITLARIGGPIVVSTLIKVLSDKDRVVRILAIQALESTVAQIPEEAVPALVELLDDDLAAPIAAEMLKSVSTKDAQEAVDRYKEGKTKRK